MGRRTSPLQLKLRNTMVNWPAELEKSFELVVFDWDGTAVTDRKDPAVELVLALQNLLDSDTICVVVTGTKIENILRQIGSITESAKENLYICTNRGSEVFTFPKTGEPKILYRRECTPTENEALDRSIKELQKDLETYHLPTRVILDRLNRRKLDLIPTDQWQDPKKSEFGKLYEAVQEQLASHHIPRGLAGCIEYASKAAKAAGLENPRVTSDIKHIEIGLTDKSDSLRWIYKNLIMPKHIPFERVVIFGDEFGPLGDVDGSDSLMRISELEPCQYVSVGIEPGGVPKPVLHLGGGPARFIDFLRSQYRLNNDPPFLEPTSDPAWVIEQEGFDASREREMESLFSIGNGYLGIRGALDFPIPASQADLFLAGVYDQKAALFPYSEPEFFVSDDRQSTQAELVPFPSPLSLQLQIDNRPIEMFPVGLKKHSRILDLKNGVYFEKYTLEDEQKRVVRIKTARLAMLNRPNLLLQEIEIRLENFAASLRVTERLFSKDDTVIYPHIEKMQLATTPKSRDIAVSLFRTKTSTVQVAIASRWFLNDLSYQGDAIYVKPNETVRIHRFISIDHSLGTQGVSKSPKSMLESFHIKSFQSLLRGHTDEWKNFWSKADIDFDRSPDLTRAQRFNLYHLRIAASKNSDTGIAARALTGRAYEGHIFWDAEIFVLPFLLFTEPELARNHLHYRYGTLQGAQARARNMGCEGACYPWESTVTGEDQTPAGIIVTNGSGTKQVPIFTGKEQIHITADVAFAVWQYWLATGDAEFMWLFGVEILVETARFWSSRVFWDKNAYHIKDVVGPDEYHHNVLDNAYTNWMARFNLDRAGEIVQRLKIANPTRWSELESRLQIKESALTQWRNVSTNLFVPRPNSKGITEQFSGFFDLRDIKLDKADRMRTPVNRLFAWEEINRLKLIKQADVLMIPFLFPDAMNEAEIRANYSYYEPLTDHGSSLSFPVHAAIASRAGFNETAKQLWERSINFDLKDLMGNTSLGMHVGCMGAAWQTLIFHFLGVRILDQGIMMQNTSKSPIVPLNPESLKMSFHGISKPLSVNSKMELIA